MRNFFLDYGLPPQNLSLGVSVEDQESADKRIPLLLLLIPATNRRFISAEPLLGQISNCYAYLLDWVIVGAETGPRARPMELSWAREIRDQCREARTPFFLKSVGMKQKVPSDLLIREWP